MHPDMQNTSEWDNWWEEQYQEFFPATLPTHEIDMISQQAVVPVMQGGQSSESGTSNEDIKSLLMTVCSRLEKIETGVQETKTFSSRACDGLHALEHLLGGVGEAVEKMKKSMSTFQKCLYNLLIGGRANEGDKSLDVKFI